MPWYDASTQRNVRQAFYASTAFCLLNLPRSIYEFSTGNFSLDYKSVVLAVSFSGEGKSSEEWLVDFDLVELTSVSG